MERAMIFDQLQKNRFNVSSSSCSKQNDSNKKKLNINDRFVLKSMIPIGNFYKTYKGIDLISRKYVTIYIKPSSKEKMFSKNIKEELRQKIAPPLKWSGTQKIDKNLFDIEVHGRFGPSLEQIMCKYRQKINEKTFYLLSYHLLKLVDRIDNAGYVNRSLSTKNVIVGQSCLKNDLYLINVFDLERKNEDSFSSVDIKYCSVGSHLKLKTSSKDTLQSMCYVLMNFYLRGTLFSDLIQQRQKDYLEAKNTLKPQGMPLLFLQFFQYVKNLNHAEEIKFTQWKIKFKKKLSQSEFSKPYQWIQKKKKDSSSVYSRNYKQDQNSCLTQNANGGFLESLFKPRINQRDSQNNPSSDQHLDRQSDLYQLQEGDLYRCEQKLLETDKFFNSRY